MTISCGDSTRKLILYPPPKLDTTNETPIWDNDPCDIENAENNVQTLFTIEKAYCLKNDMEDNIINDFLNDNHCITKTNS